MLHTFHAQNSRSSRHNAAERVVSWVQQQIMSGSLRPGQRLPPERELAVTVGASRPSVRAGLRTLMAMHVIVVRHGAGSFVTEGPPRLDDRSLGLLSSLHGFASDQVRQARLLLESEAAALAAGNATADQLAGLADSVAESFAGFSDWRTVAAHDAAFHAAVAAASGNPVLPLLVDLVARLQAARDRHLASPARRQREDAHAHQRIYRALRTRNAALAKSEMRAHLSTVHAAIDTDAAGQETVGGAAPPA